MEAADSAERGCCQVWELPSVEVAVLESCQPPKLLNERDAKGVLAESGNNAITPFLVIKKSRLPKTCKKTTRSRSTTQRVLAIEYHIVEILKFLCPMN